MFSGRAGSGLLLPLGPKASLTSFAAAFVLSVVAALGRADASSRPQAGRAVLGEAAWRL